MRTLAARERRAIAVDLPGFGEADRLAGQGDRFADGPLLPRIDRFVAELVREQPEAPLIMGNSLGGVAGLRAAQDPELPLAGVVAISPGGLGHQPWVNLFERDPLLHRVVNARVPLPGALIRWTIRTAYPRLAVFDASRADRDLVASYAAQYSSRADVARVIRDARRLLAELGTAYDLSRICRPVQLIWGARDLLTPLKGSRRVLDAVSGAELVVIERCGHCAQVEQPERVADVALRFAARTGAAPETLASD
jgi:pimeloyl-ACP methyl ester carboxylesterase